MLCSSPISARTLPKCPISVFSFAGTGIPDNAINVSNPATFRVTVFPPVFGPVISIIFSLFPNSKFIGTTVFSSIRGCLASTSFKYSLFITLGTVHFLFIEYTVLAFK